MSTATTPVRNTPSNVPAPPIEAIGADLLNLDKLQGLGAPIASIGGAGTFDGVFLTGVVAVLIASLSRQRPDADTLPEPHATKLQ